MDENQNEISDGKKLELMQKADIAISQLTSSGGLLLPEQNDTFIRKLIDQPTLLRDMRVQPMNAPEMWINKIGFGSRILRAAPQGTSPYQQDSGANNRYLPANQRVAPTTEQVKLTTSEVMAEIHIPYNVLEDNIERGGLENTIMAMLAERGALDTEELVIFGDKASSDAFLALQDGVLKLSNANVVNGVNLGNSADLWNQVKKGLPTKYRRNLNSMRLYTSMDTETDYRLAISKRQTDLGDSILTGNQVLPVLGMPMKGVALLPNTKALFTNPQNLIFGIQRNVRIEQTRDIRARAIVIVMTMRIAIGIEEKEGVVRVDNIGLTA